MLSFVKRDQGSIQESGYGNSKHSSCVLLFEPDGAGKGTQVR